MADPAEDEGEDHTESSVIRELRAKAKRADEAEARAATAERKLGLHEAGLNHLDEDQVNALIGSGPFDADAAKAKAEKWGWLKPSTPEPPAGSATAQPPTAAPPPANVAGLDQHEQFVAAGQAQETSDGGEAEFRKRMENFPGSQEEYKEFLMTEGARYLAP
jgi:hypothetical protein